MKSEPVRIFPETIIKAECLDCREVFTGPLGVRFIDIPDEGPGIEIIVIDKKRNEQHAIARVQRELVPTVVVHSIPSSDVGHA